MEGITKDNFKYSIEEFPKTKSCRKSPSADISEGISEVISEAFLEGVPIKTSWETSGGILGKICLDIKKK